MEKLAHLKCTLSMKQKQKKKKNIHYKTYIFYQIVSIHKIVNTCTCISKLLTFSHDIKGRKLEPQITQH